MSEVVIGPVQEKWLQALESKKYAKGDGYLHVVEKGESKFCCLGVYCHISNVEKYCLYEDEPDHTYTYKAEEFAECEYALPGSTWEDLGLYGSEGELADSLEVEGTDYSSIAEINDHTDLELWDIAKLIRENPEYVFKESK